MKNNRETINRSRKYRVPGKLIIYRKSDGRTLSFKCFKDEIDKIIHFNCSINNEPGINNVLKYDFK